MLSRDQVRRIDELAVQRYGIPGLMLMENAGRNAAALIDAAYGPAGRAFVACGPGNNGGDGCVIARHLHNAGWSVRLMMTGDPSRFTADTAVNFRTVQALGIPVSIAVEPESQRRGVQSIQPDDVVIDALLGTGSGGEVRSPLAELIDRLNAATKRAVVAVDVPSGLDCDSGVASRTTVRADLTITFVARKRGFAAPQAAEWIGRVEVADIGAPRELIAEIAAVRT